MISQLEIPVLAGWLAGLILAKLGANVELRDRDEQQRRRRRRRRRVESEQPANLVFVYQADPGTQ